MSKKSSKLPPKADLLLRRDVEEENEVQEVRHSRDERTHSKDSLDDLEEEEDEDLEDEDEDEEEDEDEDEFNAQRAARKAKLLHHQTLTKLVVPPQIINMPVDIASRDKELCARLEDTIIHWNKVIKEVLSNQSIMDTEDWSGPLDEIDFWENKYLDLIDITKQIRSQPVRLVRDIMQIIKSPYVAAFIKVSEEIIEGSIQALSNHHYLSTLQETCETIEVSTIKELPDQLKEVLWLFRVIWRMSPYYNTKDKLNGLLRKFSNVFILKCIKAINVKKVFNGFIESSEVTLKECLNLLLTWRTKYFEAQKMHSINSFTAWFLEYDKIFAHVDAFVQRIRDLLEICICQRLYARRIEGNREELPLYPGTKASDLTKVMTEVEKMFERQLKILSNYSSMILNVRQADWHQHMSTFKGAVKDMEMMIQHVLLNFFDTVSNIEQGIQVLECFYSFYQRESIIRVYDKLTVKLYKMFEQETLHVKRLHAQNTLPLPLTYPQIAGRAAWAIFMKRRLELNYKSITDAWVPTIISIGTELAQLTVWLPDCGYGDDVIAQYKVLVQILEDSTNRAYNEWLKQLGTKDLATRLDIPLMIRSTYKAGMIEVNFDKIVYRNIEEAQVWSRLGKEIPSVLLQTFAQSEHLHKLRETVLLVVKDYNKIVASLSAEERSLFKERIKLLDRKVYPGLTRLTWTSNVSDSYINDCRMAATKVQGFTNDYKQANIKIGKLAMKMTKYLMIKTDSQQIFDGEEFNCFQREHREKSILKIAMKYKEITLILRSVFEMFRGDGPEVKSQWLKYLNAIDDVVQEALCINFRRSLEVLSRAILGDLRGPPFPIFKLIIVLQNNQLDFYPPISSVHEMILGNFNKICQTIRPFPRVIQFLNDPSAQILSFSEVMANDEVCLTTQGKIKEGVHNCTRQVEKHLTLWAPYHDVWDSNVNSTLDRYETQNPSVAAFDSDIGKYTEISNTVQAQENIFTILFCLVDSTNIMDSISAQCKEWQDRLCKVLYDIAYAKLQNVQKYMVNSIKRFDREFLVLDELISAIRKFRVIEADVPSKENEFPGMMERFECLLKYDFHFDEMTKAHIARFPKEWSEYLQKLKVIAARLKNSKEKVRHEQMEVLDHFREKVITLMNELSENGPYTEDVTSNVAMEQLLGYHDVMESLQTEEVELLEALAVFDVDILPNRDLVAFEGELGLIKSVWEGVYEWDHWLTKKNLPPTELEDVPNHMLKKFNKFTADFTKKNWPIIDATKVRIENFKRRQ